MVGWQNPAQRSRSPADVTRPEPGPVSVRLRPRRRRHDAHADLRHSDLGHSDFGHSCDVFRPGGSGGTLVVRVRGAVAERTSIECIAYVDHIAGRLRGLVRRGHREVDHRKSNSDGPRGSLFDAVPDTDADLDHRPAEPGGQAPSHIVGHHPLRGLRTGRGGGAGDYSDTAAPGLRSVVERPSDPLGPTCRCGAPAGGSTRSRGRGWRRTACRPVRPPVGASR